MLRRSPSLTLKSIIIPILFFLSMFCADPTHARTVTDVRGRSVSVPDVVRRVVITFNIEELLAVSGPGGAEAIVGWSHRYWKGRRDDAHAAFINAHPLLADLPDVGYSDTLSVEAIISLAPDVVFMSSPVDFARVEGDLARMEDAGIAAVFFDFHAQTPETHRRSVELIGAVMGCFERAAEIAAFYDEQMRVVTDRVAQIPESSRPKVYMELSRGPSTWGTSWSTRMWGRLIGTCGGVNIAAELGDSNEVVVAPELVIASDPDVIVLTAAPRSDIGEDVELGYGADADLARSRLAAYRERPGWESLSAVRSGRLGAIYHDLSRHIFDFAGAQYLAKMIWPELFEDVDPSASLREFFARFLPEVDAGGAFAVSLLD